MKHVFVLETDGPELMTPEQSKAISDVLSDVGNAICATNMLCANVNQPPDGRYFYVPNATPDGKQILVSQRERGPALPSFPTGTVSHLC